MEPNCATAGAASMAPAKANAAAAIVRRPIAMALVDQPQAANAGNRFAG
jgi:hypothetical protein